MVNTDFSNGQAQIWVLNGRLNGQQKQPPSKKSQQNKQKECQNIVQKWIPKKLYQAQLGKLSIWVPKTTIHTNVPTQMGAPSSPSKQEPTKPNRNPLQRDKHPINNDGYQGDC